MRTARLLATLAGLTALALAGAPGVAAASGTDPDPEAGCHTVACTTTGGPVDYLRVRVSDAGGGALAWGTRTATAPSGYPQATFTAYAPIDAPTTVRLSGELDVQCGFDTGTGVQPVDSGFQQAPYALTLDLSAAALGCAPHHGLVTVTAWLYATDPDGDSTPDAFATLTLDDN